MQLSIVELSKLIAIVVGPAASPTQVVKVVKAMAADSGGDRPASPEGRSTGGAAHPGKQ
jgi:hypothetical protein